MKFVNENFQSPAYGNSHSLAIKKMIPFFYKRSLLVVCARPFTEVTCLRAVEALSREIEVIITSSIVDGISVIKLEI